MFFRRYIDRHSDRHLLSMPERCSQSLHPRLLLVEVTAQTLCYMLLLQEVACVSPAMKCGFV